MEIDLGKLTEYLRKRGTVLLLDSQSPAHTWSHKTYLAALPEAEIQARGDEITVNRNGTTQKQRGDPWQLLQEFQQTTDSWLFGYLGYDLKNYVEDLSSRNADAVEAPDLYFMVPELLVEIDPTDGSYVLLKGNLPLDMISNTKNPGRAAFYSLRNFRPQVTRQGYRKLISEAQHRITEGEIYEVNISHQMKGRFKGSPLALYHQMKEAGPVPFGAFIQGDGWAVCCQSPERFLRKKGTTVISQPIKGTARRSKNERKDHALKDKLVSSQKERAENLMIVDLVRNDMSRFARYGSVKVPQLFNIESFQTVHQMVSTVTAESEEDNPVTILKTCFPMGSMTGAPKIRAMKIIEELEGYRRGIYSGAIGYITPHNDFDFNVVIRTAVITEGDLFYSVGGAITCDSDPGDEWQETLIKARALTDIQ